MLRTALAATAALALLVPTTAAAAPAAPSRGAGVIEVPASGETEPVRGTGDAADDPAVWVHPTDPARSLVLGNDKKGALETYDLSGRRLQRITSSTAFWGNVDVRGDVVAAWNGGGVRVYRVDPRTRLLQPATEGSGVVPTVGGEGLCLWQGPDALHVVAIARSGVLRQYRLTDDDRDGRVDGELVRRVDVGSEAEGCAADDGTGALYVSEEDVALWRYGADPASGARRTAVDRVAPRGRIAADAEGVTVAGDLVVVSAQATGVRDASLFHAYDRRTGAHVRTFRVVGGPGADDCDATDGVAAHEGYLGPRFPRGLLVCQDGHNAAPGGSGRQAFTLVRWERVTGS
ncbi:phytase [Vallicoccus soli]|uniref:phytase n=1 Tax=Vallicoccus soli TaxID=2339232 RepID=UPI0014041736|nr:phytase [Vallicoccus soli]